MTQIVKVANMFAVTVHDLTLPVSLHVSAVRVLFTITERLHQTDVSLYTAPLQVLMLFIHVVKLKSKYSPCNFFLYNIYSGKRCDTMTIAWG